MSFMTDFLQNALGEKLRVHIRLSNFLNEILNLYQNFIERAALRTQQFGFCNQAFFQLISVCRQGRASVFSFMPKAYLSNFFTCGETERKRTALSFLWRFPRYLAEPSSLKIKENSL